MAKNKYPKGTPLKDLREASSPPHTIRTMSDKPIESKDCELDAKTKKALYRDDFDSKDGWQNVCNMLNVPTSADQIYFNVKEVTYGG